MGYGDVGQPALDDGCCIVVHAQSNRDFAPGRMERARLLLSAVLRFSVPALQNGTVEEYQSRPSRTRDYLTGRSLS